MALAPQVVAPHQPQLALAPQVVQTQPPQTLAPQQTRIHSSVPSSIPMYAQSSALPMPTPPASTIPPSDNRQRPDQTAIIRHY
ncbi:MAG: hypothetical protein AAGM46_28260, partial [Cyanobacteria bacterium J06582_2]